MTRLVLALAGCALAACGGPPEPPPAPPPPSVAAIPAPPPAPVAPSRRTPELCAVLAGLMEAERAGFTSARGARLGPEQWQGRARPPDLEDCRIEGDAWPRARYLCASAPFGEADRARADARFAALVGEIDRCLASPTWFPRRWQKGTGHEFAMGERLQSWTDVSREPPSAVTLKVERDLISDDYRLRLNLETIR